MIVRRANSPPSPKPAEPEPEREPSAAALRNRKLRRRKKLGAMVVDFEVDPDDVTDLRAIGLLASADAENRTAIELAVRAAFDEYVKKMRDASRCTENLWHDEIRGEGT